MADSQLLPLMVIILAGLGLSTTDLPFQALCLILIATIIAVIRLTEGYQSVK